MFSVARGCYLEQHPTIQRIKVTLGIFVHSSWYPYLCLFFSFYSVLVSESICLHYGEIHCLYMSPPQEADELFFAYTQSNGSVPQKKKCSSTKNPVEVTLASCPKSTIKSTKENYQSILDECFNRQSSLDEFLNYHFVYMFKD